jgi:DNA polymerase I-like protein with 3'-5' exonuclease and polymerase domains
MLTPTGQPKIAEKGEVCTNLLKLGDFAKVGEYFVLKHRKGLIEGLLQVIRKDGTIPSEADTLGAATGRYTHRKIVNLPAVRSEYGEQIRSMFKARDGYKFLGVDLSGIEARMLAHYMDDEEFTDTVLNGDIHTFNQQKAGLPTRDSAKTFFYGFIYGAGDEKVGQLVGKGKAVGKKIKEYYFLGLPSLKRLIDEKKKEALKGFITTLDGRKVRIRRDIFTGEIQTHKALNVLLQSSATIYFKTWMVLFNMYVSKSSKDVHQLIAMHDEIQMEVREEDVEWVKAALNHCIKQADKLLSIKCENACEIKVGSNWMETH